MSYPCITKDEGIALYKRIIENGESYDSVKNKINEVTYQKDNGNFKIELAEMSIEEILEKNKNIQFLDDQNNIAKPARFERFASVILHKTLNLDNVIAFDQEFWIWFSFFSKIFLVSNK